MKIAWTVIGVATVVGILGICLEREKAAAWATVLILGVSAAAALALYTATQRMADATQRMAEEATYCELKSQQLHSSDRPGVVLALELSNIGQGVAWDLRILAPDDTEHDRRQPLGSGSTWKFHVPCEWEAVAVEWRPAQTDPPKRDVWRNIGGGEWHPTS